MSYFLTAVVPDRSVPERLTHFRDLEGTKNESILPGRLYLTDR